MINLVHILRYIDLHHGLVQDPQERTQLSITVKASSRELELEAGALTGTLKAIASTFVYYFPNRRR